jgi:hypothetical protein
MSTFDQEVKDEAVKMMQGYKITELLRQVQTAARSIGDGTDVLADNLIDVANVVVTEAATKRLNAAYGGSHDDGGAGAWVEKLKNYLEGVVTGLTGSMSDTSPYARTLKKIKQDQDPEYQKYLELKAKFGDN